MTQINHAEPWPATELIRHAACAILPCRPGDMSSHVSMLSAHPHACSSRAHNSTCHSFIHLLYALHNACANCHQQQIDSSTACLSRRHQPR